MQTAIHGRGSNNPSLVLLQFALEKGDFLHQGRPQRLNLKTLGILAAFLKRCCSRYNNDCVTGSDLSDEHCGPLCRATLHTTHYAG